MDDMNDALEKYDFKFAGEIVINQDCGLVDFKITEDEFKQRVPQVYAWVVDGVIKYIGKAGKGINMRLSQHRGGWRGGSTTGITKAAYLTEALASNRVEVYGRTCEFIKEEITLFGKKQQVEINMIDIEETFLIAELKPDWNVVGK